MDFFDWESIQESTIFKLVWNILSNLLPTFIYIAGSYFAVCLIGDYFCLLPFLLYFVGLIFEIILTLIYKKIYYKYTGFPSLILMAAGIFIQNDVDLKKLLPLLTMFFLFTLFNALIWGNLYKTKRVAKAIGYVLILVTRILFAFLTYYFIRQTINISSEYFWRLNSDLQLSILDVYLFVTLISIHLIPFFNAVQLIILHDGMHNILNQLYKISSWSLDTTVLKRKLLNGSNPLQLTDRTVVIGDIRGFTSFTENHKIEEVVDLLRNFYKLVEKIVEKYKGFKPEFIGDEFITFFKSPEDAVKFSFEISRELCRFLKKYGLSVGFGIEKGKIIEGVIGGESSKKYTLIGRPINIAARLQAKAKSGEILVSMNVAESVPNLSIKDRGDVFLKGVSSEFQCCQLCEYKPNRNIEFSSKFEQVLDRFFSFISLK